VDAVAGEELAAAWARQPKNMLDVWSRSGERAADGGIERSAYCGEEENAGDPRADLEAAVGDVLVWHAIACEVKQEPKRERAEPRADD
jgi:hypothetical protein